MSLVRFNAGRLRFEWESEKAAANRIKHGVSFLEAASAFGDLLSVIVPDPLHSAEENRFLLLGMSAESRLLLVVHAERGLQIRIISARKPTRQERRVYEHGDEN